MLCAAYLTETRHTGGDSFGNVFVIGQVLVQNTARVVFVKTQIKTV